MDHLVSAGTLDVTGYAQQVKSLTIGANGLVSIDTTHPLASLNGITINSTGSAIDIVGGIATPDLLMTYTSGGQPNAFSSIYYNGVLNGLPSGDSLQYRPRLDRDRQRAEHGPGDHHLGRQPDAVPGGRDHLRVDRRQRSPTAARRSYNFTTFSNLARTNGTLANFSPTSGTVAASGGSVSYTPTSTARVPRPARATPSGPR